MNNSALIVLLFSALTGAIVSLPTGPTGAYVVSRRMSQGVSAMITAIIAIIITDNLYVWAILKGHSIVATLLNNNILFILGFCIVIIALGIQKIIHPKIATRPSNIDPSLKKLSSTIAGTFIVTAIINILNPLLVFSLVSLLTAFGLIANDQIVLIAIGYSIGCIGLWTLVGCLLEYSFRRAEHHLKTIVQACGVIMIVTALITATTALGNQYAIDWDSYIVQVNSSNTTTRKTAR